MVAMDPMTLELAGQPFLRGLRPVHLAEIAACATIVSFPAGQLIFREGDPATSFFILRRGRVALQLVVPGRGPTTIQTVGEGDVLGWSWLFPPYRWQFDATALDLTRAVALDADCLRRAMEGDHELGYHLMRRFAQTISDRLQATRLQMLDVYGHAPGR